MKGATGIKTVEVPTSVLENAHYRDDIAAVIVQGRKPQTISFEICIRYQCSEGFQTLTISIINRRI